MITSLANYFYERRRGLAKTAGVLGGLYLAGNYVMQRLEEVRDRVLEDRNARDNLRRRFQQNQQDVSYMILGLIPTLAEQILEGMDVETLTQELQQVTKAAKLKGKAVTPAPVPPPAAPLSESAMTLFSSVEVVQDRDARSDSASVVSYPSHDRSTSDVPSNSGSPKSTADLSRSSQSWVDEFEAQSTSGLQLQTPLAPSGTESESGAAARLSESFLTDVSAASSNPSEAPSIAHSHATNESTSTRSKAELWNELKILTFTRTLTVLYSATLLSLFTHTQLALLGRIKYVQSVVHLEREERRRDSFQLEASLALSALGLDNIAATFGDDPEQGSTEDGDSFFGAAPLADQTERKYLTLSWWILHVGWKDVGERVRKSVEDVFEGVSLKTKLSAMDLHRLLSDVRRRVEHEVTFEGQERKISFLSTLLPSTPETLHHVLTKAGIRVAPPPFLHLPSYHISASSPSSASPYPSDNFPPHPDADPAFTALLAETSALLNSSDFAHVLEACLDSATDILCDGLERNVFAGAGPEADGQEEPRIRLAGMLPGLARWSQLALTGLPNELVDNIADVREVSSFSAIIFSAFEDRVR